MIHEYKENFKELIEYLSQTSGIRADILEKRLLCIAFIK